MQHWTGWMQFTFSNFVWIEHFEVENNSNGQHFMRFSPMFQLFQFVSLSSPLPRNFNIFFYRKTLFCSTKDTLRAKGTFQKFSVLLFLLLVPEPPWHNSCSLTWVFRCKSSNIFCLLKKANKIFLHLTSTVYYLFNLIFDNTFFFRFVTYEWISRFIKLKAFNTVRIVSYGWSWWCFTRYNLDGADSDTVTVFGKSRIHVKCI